MKAIMIEGFLESTRNGFSKNIKFAKQSHLAGDTKGEK